MNRIILIGNGFDLAHNLKTSYKDFIDYLWKDKIENFKKFYPQFNDIDIDIVGLNSSYIYEKMNSINTFEELESFLRSINVRIQYKNKFLEIITRKTCLQNWVDIEEEYYTQIKQIINNKSDNTIAVTVTALNQDFSNIKQALEKYLRKITEQTIDKNDEIEAKIYSEFDLRDITNKGVNGVIEEQWDYYQKLKEENIKESYRMSYKEEALIECKPMNRDSFNQFIMKESKDYFWLIPKNILFLNFNYTNSENPYKDYTFTKFDYFEHKYSYKIDKEIIHIHGELNNSHNPVIFGYGDELDDDYSRIEKLNDNNFLKNVKSMNYLETDNYKRLLNFINLDNYQIFIFGHSCGISDRTLLNKLFEHDNCISIKVFYYTPKDETDNFGDIIKNISRNFTNKAVMRERVVNKKYCVPLIET
jgi:hypothetical protein